MCCRVVFALQVLEMATRVVSALEVVEMAGRVVSALQVVEMAGSPNWSVGLKCYQPGRVQGNSELRVHGVIIIDFILIY